MKYINYDDLFDILPKVGATYLIPQCASIPVNLMSWFKENDGWFKNIDLWCDNPIGVSAFKNFRYTTFYNNKYVRDLPTTDYIPGHFNETPAIIADKKVDVYFSLLSENKGNKASVGISVDYCKAAMSSAKLKIAIKNGNVPYTYGDGEVRLSDFDYIIEDNFFALQTLEKDISGPDLITDKISNFIVEKIEDGSCLQVGIGSIPDSVLTKLKGKNDLGIHTEMVSHQAIELIKNGNVTNKRKSIDKGKTILTFVLGTLEDYRFFDHNRKTQFRTADYTNNPCNVAKNDKVVAINSALEVDLTGQVNAEYLNKRQYTGVGGQANFVQGAKLSRGGKSFIALPSTAKEFSRIVPCVKMVTTSRNIVDYVCTEYGCVRLTGKTLKERKELLISIAHPKFRKELRGV